MSVYEDFHNENSIMNLKVYLIGLIILVFNTFIWTVIFDNYKSFHKESVREMTSENERLKSLVEEFKLEGIEVTVTMYHPVRSQTDSTPNILADGTRIRVHKASEYRFIAVSRNLLKRHGGFLEYGDFIVLKGTGQKDGVYQVRDTMNPKWVNVVDILESENVVPYKYENVHIYKMNWTDNLQLIQNNKS